MTLGKRDSVYTQTVVLKLIDVANNDSAAVIGVWKPYKRGKFIDIRTAAAALTDAVNTKIAVTNKGQAGSGSLAVVAAAALGDATTTGYATHTIIAAGASFQAGDEINFLGDGDADGDTTGLWIELNIQYDDDTSP